MRRTQEERRHAEPGTRLAILALILSAAVGLSVPSIALAQGRGGGDWHGGGERGGAAPHGGEAHGGGWHGSVGAWHGGRWHQGWHNGRFGWWWAVPGYDWYAYDEPAYPYPAYPVTGYPGTPTAPYYWYYCQSPVGYYPYIQQCAGPWQPVPAPG